MMKSALLRLFIICHAFVKFLRSQLKHGVYFPVFFFCQVNLVIFVMLLKVVFSKLGTKYSNEKLIKTRYVK